MKKEWSTPAILDLTLQATERGGFGGFGGGGGFGGFGGGGFGDGCNTGRDDICRCQGGTSPCSKHHYGDFS